MKGKSDVWRLYWAPSCGVGLFVAFAFLRKAIKALNSRETRETMVEQPKG